jgi:hypothetical protein
MDVTGDDDTTDNSSGSGNSGGKPALSKQDAELSAAQLQHQRNLALLSAPVDARALGLQPASAGSGDGQGEGGLSVLDAIFGSDP